MPLSIWNGATWTEANRLKVWNGTSWVDCAYGKVWNGSSWVEFFTGYSARLDADTYIRFASPASFQVNSNGYVYGSVGVQQLVQQYQWLTGIGSSGDYQVYATVAAGFSPTGSALDTWITLSSSAQWNLTATAGNFRQSILNVSIRLTAAPNTVLATATIDLECDRS
jgi:hypothetical protein